MTALIPSPSDKFKVTVKPNKKIKTKTIKTTNGIGKIISKFCQIPAPMVPAENIPSIESQITTIPPTKFNLAKPALILDNKAASKSKTAGRPKASQSK